MVGLVSTKANTASSAEASSVEDLEARQQQRRYDRLAWLYDVMQSPGEWLVQARMRRRLLSAVPATGALLELGVGTGLNLPLYPREIRATAIDLSGGMLERARRRAASLDLNVDLHVANAEQLPFADRSFDCVIASFVFCSISDPVQALREAGRVCRPKGRILLAEHVRPEGRLIGALADLLDPLCYYSMGFHLNRRTVEHVHAAGLQVTRLERRAGVFRLIEARPAP